MLSGLWSSSFQIHKIHSKLAVLVKIIHTVYDNINRPHHNTKTILTIFSNRNTICTVYCNSYNTDSMLTYTSPVTNTSCKYWLSSAVV